MIYIYRIYQLVKIVHDETNNSTDPLRKNGLPDLQYCLIVFKSLNKKYTDQLARKTLAMATGQEGYLIIAANVSAQRLQVSSAGLELLSPTGFTNAMFGAINNIPAPLALIISVAALAVSILKK